MIADGSPRSPPFRRTRPVDLTFHRNRCIVFDMNAHDLQIAIPTPLTLTTRTTQKVSPREFWKRIHVVPAAATGFMRTSTLQGIRKGDANPARTTISHPKRQSSDSSSKKSDARNRSSLSRRDLKRIVRMERALTHVPLDVEFTRIMSDDEFPSYLPRFP